MNWLLFGLIWSLEILVVIGYIGLSNRRSEPSEDRLSSLVDQSAT